MSKPKSLGGRHYTYSQVNPDGTVPYIGGSVPLAIDVWGTPKYVFPVSLFHGLWTFDVPQSQWLVYEDNVEVAPSSVTGCFSTGGAAKLDTGQGGAGTFSSVLLTSKRHPRYQPNRGHRFATALYCPDAGNNGTAEWGLFTDNAGTIEDGAFFRLEADGSLSAVVVSGGSEVYDQTIDTSVVVNPDGTGFDITKGNLFDLRYQWRGVGDYFWFVQQKLVHYTTLLGARTGLSIRNPGLPCSYKVTNITEDQSLIIGCVDIESEGGNDQKVTYNSAYNEVTGTGSEIPVVSIHQPDTISGRINTRDVRLARVTMYCEAKSIFNVYITRDITGMTAASFAAIGSGSYVEIDTSATAVPTNKQLLATLGLGVTSDGAIDNPLPDTIEFVLVRGDYIVVTVNTTNTKYAGATIEFGEEI